MDGSAEAPDLARIAAPGDATLLYGIGAHRAGLLRLASYLSGTSEVHFPPNRDVHYFDTLAGNTSTYGHRATRLRTLAESLGSAPGPDDGAALAQVHRLSAVLAACADATPDHEAYLAYMTRDMSPAARIAADFTSAYADLPAEVFAQMARVEGARFVLILRDPIDRLWSQIRLLAHRGGAAGPGFDAACADIALRVVAGKQAVPATDYAATVATLLSAVPEERVHIAFTETLFTDEGIRGLCAFLGIPFRRLPARGPIRPVPPANLDESLGRTLMWDLLPQYQFALEVFEDVLPHRWLENFDRYIE